MELKFKVDGKMKTFKQPASMPAVRFKQSIALAMAFEKDFSPELLDRIVEFIANDLYCGKFTPEQFWEGMENDDFIRVLMEQLASPSNRAKGFFETLKN